MLLLSGIKSGTEDIGNLKVLDISRVQGDNKTKYSKMLVCVGIGSVVWVSAGTQM